MVYKKKSLLEIVKGTIGVLPLGYFGGVIVTTRGPETFGEALTDEKTLQFTLIYTAGYISLKLLIEGGRRLYYSRKERKGREDREALERKINDTYPDN